MNTKVFGSISFPLFGIEVNPGRALEIGPLTIYYYGICIALGLILAVLYGCKRSKDFGIKEDDVVDGVLCVTPFAIICARLYYVLFTWDQFAGNPISVLYIWNGGLAIYGGVIGAAIGVAVLCKVKKIKLAALLDLVALGFLIGQAIGRWGNFFNREAFGSSTESIFKMGLYHLVLGEYVYFHPTFLYESLWNVLGFVGLHFLSKRRQYDGQIALGYVAWYGLGRALIEGLRVDSLYLGSIRISQLLAAVTCVAAVVVLLLNTSKRHDPAKLLVNQVAEKEAAARAEAEAEAEDAAEAPVEADEATAEAPADEQTEAPAEEE